MARGTMRINRAAAIKVNRVVVFIFGILAPQALSATFSPKMPCGRISKKTIRTSKKYMAHDENNEAKTGDVVKIMETRPLSKNKRWRLVEIVRKAETLE